MYVSTTRTTIVCPACKLKKFERTETRCPRCHHSLGITYVEICLPGSLEPDSPQRVVVIREELGGIIRSFRSSRKVTQAALASRTGIHRTYLSRIERGRVLPTIVSLLQIACALGVRQGRGESSQPYRLKQHRWRLIPAQADRFIAEEV